MTDQFIDTEYLTIHVRPNRGGSTKIGFVYSKRTTDLLAQIKWYGAWRQYAMFPEPGTIWNPDCMDAVNEVIRDLMAERKTTE